VTANGDRGVFSISSTTWLSWICPPVTVKRSGRPFAVDYGVDFPSSTAPADADRLIFLPILPRSPAVCFHDGAVDQIQTIARLGRQPIENAQCC
jgi:hypothetical protein